MSSSVAQERWEFETLKVRGDGAVLHVQIAAPPMNLLGPELVRDLVVLIQRAEATAGHAAIKSRVNAISLAPAEDFRLDSELFGQHVGDGETQRA